MNPDDVIRWPDDSWCYRHELAEFNHKSDDYEVLAVGTPAYAVHQAREAPRSRPAPTRAGRSDSSPFWPT